MRASEASVKMGTDVLDTVVALIIRTCEGTSSHDKDGKETRVRVNADVCSNDEAGESTVTNFDSEVESHCESG